MPVYWQPGKVPLAFGVVILIYLILHHLSWNPDWSSPVYIADLKSGGAKSSSRPALREDAHKLPTADAFLPHIKEVLEMPGMTMAEAKAGCKWPDSKKINFMYGNDADWVVKDESDKMIDARREEWQLFMKNGLIPWEDHKHRFHGRGIVIVAGQLHGLKRVKVILRALKRVGSQLPVEINYWSEELTQEIMDDISILWPKLYFNDLSADSNVVKTQKNYHWNNFHLKTAAVVNSRFAEPLLLDSDNIPVVDPESLYEDPIYQEYGTLFWPDIARTRPNNPMWPLTNTQCRMDEYEQESGQLMVDKRKFFYHLQLAAWFNNVNAQYYIRFMLGDKDLFRFSWHALKTKFGRPAKWLTSVGTLTDGYYCGHTFAQHHPNGSIAFLHGGLLKVIPKEVMIWQREKRGGIFQAYKRSNHDEDHSHIENVNIKWDPGNYLPNKPENLRVGSCTDFYEVNAKPFDDLIPGFQQTFEDLGGYWMLDDATANYYAPPESKSESKSKSKPAS